MSPRCIRRPAPPLYSAVFVSALFASCVAYEPVPLSFAEQRAGLLDLLESTQAQELEFQPPGAWFPLAPIVDFSDGLTLAEANSVALLHSPHAEHASHIVELASARAQAVGLLSNPSLFLGPRIDLTGSGLILPITGSWNLPVGSARSARRDRAKAKVEVLHWRKVQVELELLVEVRTLFVRHHWLGVQLAELDAGLLPLRETIERYGVLARAGETRGAELALAELELLEIEAELSALTRERNGLVLELQALLGVHPALEMDFATTIPAPASPTSFELDGESLEAHPKLREIAAEYRAAEESLRLACAEQFPDLTLGPEFEDDDGQGSLGLGLGIELPFFDTGEAAIEVARLERDVVRHHYRSSLLELSIEHARIVQGAQNHSAGLLRHREWAAQAAVRAADAMQALAMSGEASLTELFRAQLALLGSRRTELRLEAAVQLTATQLLLYQTDYTSPDLQPCLIPEDPR